VERRCLHQVFRCKPKYLIIRISLSALLAESAKLYKLAERFAVLNHAAG